MIVLISALRFRPNGDGKWTSALGEASSQFEIDVVDQFESLTFHEIYEVAIAEEGFVTGQDGEWLPVLFFVRAHTNGY